MLIMVTSGEGYAVENMKELSLFMSKPLYFFLFQWESSLFVIMKAIIILACL